MRQSNETVSGQTAFSVIFMMQMPMTTAPGILSDDGFYRNRSSDLTDDTCRDVASSQPAFASQYESNAGT
jgi:hypothetical protein